MGEDFVVSSPSDKPDFLRGCKVTLVPWFLDSYGGNRVVDGWH